MAATQKQIESLARARQIRKEKAELAKENDVSSVVDVKDPDIDQSARKPAQINVITNKYQELEIWGNAVASALISCGVNHPSKLNVALAIADDVVEAYKKRVK